MTDLQVRDEISVTAQLAWSVLFGEEFLRSADPRLLKSVQDDPAAWGRLITDTWSVFSTLGGGSPRHPARQIQAAPAAVAPVAAVAPAAPAIAAAPVVEPAAEPAAPAAQQSAEVVTAPAAAPAPVVTAPAPAPAVTAPAAPVKAAEPAVQPSRSVVFFDPDDEAPRPAKGAPTLEEIKAKLVEFVAEVSGYPPEIFDEDLDLEVDLGIDSIKQVQTLARVREHYGLAMDEGFMIRDYATIKKLADYIAGRPASGV